jgi:hypothetical protein
LLTGVLHLLLGAPPEIWLHHRPGIPKRNILLMNKYLSQELRNLHSHGKARLTLLQPATENSKEGKTKQRTKYQETKTIAV